MNQLFELIKTEEDRQEALAFLESFSRALFTQTKPDPNGKFANALKETLGPDFGNLSISARDNKIKELIAQIKSFPTVEAQIAAAPTDLTLEKINQFVQKKTNTHSILNIKIKPEILGGVILIIDGKYYDFSISKKLNQAFEKQTLETLTSASD